MVDICRTLEYIHCTIRIKRHFYKFVHIQDLYLLHFVLKTETIEEIFVYILSYKE